MNSEEDEFKRIEREAKRQAAQPMATQDSTYWQAEAERYANNTDYWRKRCNAAEQQAKPVFDCPRCGHVCSHRKWQGLTPEEVKHLYPYGRSIWGKETFEAIEKALKAKNNG